MTFSGDLSGLGAGQGVLALCGGGTSFSLNPVSVSEESLLLMLLRTVRQAAWPNLAVASTPPVLKI